MATPAAANDESVTNKLHLMLNACMRISPSPHPSTTNKDCLACLTNINRSIKEITTNKETDCLSCCASSCLCSPSSTLAIPAPALRWCINVLPITPDRASSTSGRGNPLPCISCSLAAGRRHPGALALFQLVAALTAAEVVVVERGAEPRSYGLPLGQLALQAGTLLKSQDSFSSVNYGEKYCIRIHVAFRLYLVKII
jgi:hypothetical protein